MAFKLISSGKDSRRIMLMVYLFSFNVLLYLGNPHSQLINIVEELNKFIKLHDIV